MITPITDASNSDATNMPIGRLILVYPTLIVAILGALPTLNTFIQSRQLNVPQNEVEQAKQQLDLLTANLSCTAQAMNHPLKTRNNITIGAVVCDSGDVAIVAQDAHAGSYPNPVIVPWKTMVSGDTNAQASIFRSLSPIAFAYAQQPQPAPTSAAGDSTATVICQRLQDKNNLLRRIKTPDGRCLDVVTNVYNRKLVSQTPAECVPTC